MYVFITKKYNMIQASAHSVLKNTFFKVLLLFNVICVCLQLEALSLLILFVYKILKM